MHASGLPHFFRHAESSRILLEYHGFFYIFGCRIPAKQLQTFINCLLLLELDMTIRMLGESCSQVVLQVTFIGEVKRLLEGHDLTVDCRGVGRKEGGIIYVDDEKDSPLNKKAGVHFGLVESPGEEPILDVLMPCDLAVL